MSTKLTLTVDQNVIESAKEYARKNRRSLSNIIEEYLKSLTQNTTTKKKPKLSKLVRELKGSVKDPAPNKSYKEILSEELIKKHLK